MIQKLILKLYGSKSTYHLFVDASSHGVRRVLKQRWKRYFTPNANHSRNLKDCKKNYAITKLECLAIIGALNKFYCYVHRQKFILNMKHVALT